MGELHGLVVNIRPGSEGKMADFFFFFLFSFLNSSLTFFFFSLLFKLLVVVGFCFVLLHSQN